MIMLFEHGLFATESQVYEKKHAINMEDAAVRAAEHRGNSMYSEEEPGVRQDELLAGVRARTAPASWTTSRRCSWCR